jgi:hypothetical protein
MIPFSILEQIINRSRKSLESRERDGELKSYTKAGGVSGRGWSVTGFYTRETDESRLVFEALHYELPELCLIRVYRENPLEILFARKWCGDMARFEQTVAKAAMVFRAALPIRPLPSDDFEEGLEDIPLSAEDRELLSSVLTPIPPPCNPDAIEEA